MYPALFSSMRTAPDVDSIAWDLASYITYDLDLETRR